MDPTYPKVIRLDLRYRSAGTPTDCAFELPYAVEFPQGVQCYISAFSCPHAWFKVDAGLSDLLYVIEVRTQGGASVRRCRVLQLEAGNYTSMTLPPALQNLLNSTKSFPNSTYAVTYVASQGCLRIELTGSDATARFQLPSEDELLSQNWRTANWTGTADAYSPGDLHTMGDLLRIPAVSTPSTLLLRVCSTSAPSTCCTCARHRFRPTTASGHLHGGFFSVELTFGESM